MGSIIQICEGFYYRVLIYNKVYNQSSAIGRDCGRPEVENDQSFL